MRKIKVTILSDKDAAEAQANIKSILEGAGYGVFINSNEWVTLE